MRNPKQDKKKQGGFIVSAEMILIATITVIGLIVGMAAVRDALTAELHDIASAIGNLDQSYNFAGINDNNTNTMVAGSALADLPDNVAPTMGVTGAAGIFGDQNGLNKLTADDDENGP